MAQNFNHSTSGLPDARSIESWREAMAEVYYRLDVKPESGDRVNGQIADWQSDHIGISQFQADAQRVVRTKEAARRDRSEDFVFLFPTEGAMRFQQCGKSGMVRPGDVFLLNSAEPYVVDVPENSANITIKIGCERLIERLPCLHDLCGTSGFANPHLVPAFVMLGQQILRLETTRKESALEQVIIDLVEAMIEAGRASPPPAVYVRPQLGELLHKRLLAFVRSRLGDHSLSPEMVAREFRISVRYVHKIFQQHSQSFGRVVLQQRLHKARALIAGHLGPGRINLAEVAYVCGFASQAHFSSSYKALFGEAPSAMRSGKPHPGDGARN